MLSAVAARKLRESQSVSTDVSPEKQTVDRNPPRKRKTSSTKTQTPPSTRKKQRKSGQDSQLKKYAKTPVTRYYDAQDSSNSSDDQDVDIGSSSSDDDALFSGFPATATMASSSSNTGRWSPSAPAGAYEDEDETMLESSALPSHISLPTIPIFHAVENQNLFHLSSEETSQLFASSSSDSAIIVLEPSQSAGVLGTYTLRVLQGSITVCGTSIDSSQAHRIHAPRCSPIPVLEAQAVISTPVQADASLKLQSLLAPFTGKVVLLIEELYTGVEGLGRAVRTFEDVYSSRFSKTREILSGVWLINEAGKDLHPYVLPSSWKCSLDGLTNETASLRYLVRGPKRSGKSTFGRTLVNNLLRKHKSVAYLECDIGQSEFTPGGMVALNIITQPIFGPPYTHPSTPVHAHFIGSFTPLSSPSTYLAAIESLMEFYTLNHELDEDTGLPIPLVVNTMGWTKGLGGDLIRRIEDYVRPTTVYSFDSDATSEKNCRLLESAGVQEGGGYTAADFRNIMIMSYFHATSSATWDTSVSLRSRPPYEVTIAEAIDEVILIGNGSEDVVASEIGRVLNGALVALCSPTNTSMLSNDGIPYVQGSTLPIPPPPCHGLAVLRSLSLDEQHLHILTPISPTLLPECRLLVKGEIQLPIWGFVHYKKKLEEVEEPYLQWSRSNALGGEKRRVRRNLMRRGQA